MDNYIVLPINNCISFNHVVKSFCLPIKTACNNTVIDGWFVECGSQWNCNQMCSTDQRSFIDVPIDGKIMFQTNFNVKTGILGEEIIIELYDLSDQLISDDHTTFASRWVVGTDGKSGYQTIEIDFSLIDVTCGYFKIKSGDIEVCTEYFKKDDCVTFVEIESIVSKYDCWNNYYGLSNGDFQGTDFKYSNKMYLKGSTKLFSVSNKNLETLRFTPKALVAPFVAKYLSNKILKQKQIIIDGDTWNTKDTTLSAREKSSMFWPILEFERKPCKSDNTNCN